MSLSPSEQEQEEVAGSAGGRDTRPPCDLGLDERRGDTEPLRMVSASSAESLPLRRAPSTSE